MEGFYRKKGSTRELLTKGRIIFRPGNLLGVNEQGFLLFRLPLLSVEDEDCPYDRLPQ